ncbi:MAG: hypothetical protein VX762_02870 [Bacteroidota bacterium]|nr:hypothetical protein [Bacteroidota bacterium]
MNNKVKQIVTLSLAFFSIALIGKENVENLNATSVVNTKVAAGCNPSTSQTDLDVNNVRTIIMAGGDMWWNLDDARYEIPKNGNKHSMFAGALWIGGVDDGGQLKVAAMTYRQSGNDFWPGPLNISNATITAEECNKWDNHFKLERSDVEEYVARIDTDPTYEIPAAILDWPAHGDPAQGQDEFLAPFFDVNGNGVYEPYDGDYPDYNITGTNEDAKLFGDQTLFWIFNDKGNIHTETEAEPLGLEIHAQAFGFTADNEVNDMTFYNYKIINRSTLPLNDTYFGQWVDPDLGYYLDDYVGCDVGLGLGFCYNGDAEDEGAAGYGFNPPAIGVDFFQGPLSDEGDNIDNDRDGVTDELDTLILASGDTLFQTEKIIMSKFVYYNNDFTVTGNPESGTDIYNYLRGIWKDNVPMTYGGDGHGGGSGSTTTLCDFMFPGTSDANFEGQEWTEVTAGNIPADRRFLQSAGPFTLEAGAVNMITTGVVWARAKSGGQTASIQLLKVYDREAQALFDNNFNILNGPDAPDLTIRELDKELIFTLSNSGTSNNIDNSYSEKDPYIGNPDNLLNYPNYEFQGYLVYQLKDATVSVTNLDDPDKARLIYRSDIKDDVLGIVNQYLDPTLGVYTPIEEVAAILSEGVIGSVNEGIEFSFQISDDKFALGNTRLVNHKTYYFMSLAYGYNRAEENASPYDVDADDYDGRNQPYISGRRNIQVYSAIPHFTDSENGGMILNASYGDGVKITRLEGQGNGGMALELTAETVNEILTSEDHRSLYPTYEQTEGPIAITVVDPVKITQGDFTFKLMDPQFNNPISASITSYGRWELFNNETGYMVSSDNIDIESIFDDNDIWQYDLGESNKYIDALGLNANISIGVQPGAGPDNIENNGLISGTIEFEDINDRWLSGVADSDDELEFFSLWGFNWIRAGSFENTTNALLGDYGVGTKIDDPNGAFEGAVVQTNIASLPWFMGGTTEWSGGTWAPYRFASHFNDGPGLQSSITNLAKLSNLNSVDVVITDDKSKWSRVCVVEAQDDPLLAEGGQVKMGLRQSPSVDQDGNDDGSGTMGLGWFPGYAIDIETGERLNIIFSEDSWQTSENGNDMIWNPTGKLITDEFPLYDGQQFSGGNYLLGGKHFIYVVKGEAWVKGTEDYMNDMPNCDFSPNYDESAWIYAKLLGGTLTGKWSVFKNVTWVGAPLLAPGRALNLSNTATVKLRVAKPYKQYETVAPYIDYNNDLVITDNEVIIKDKNTDLTLGNTYVVAYENSATTWGGKTVTYDGIDYQVGESFIATGPTNLSGSTSVKARVIEANALNSFNPTYSFSTDDIVAEKGNVDVAFDAMETIKVVPNPYYGYSSYETNQLDNRVKIINLSGEATVKIFSVGGGLIRTLKKDDSMTSIDWDLKNDFGIPIASGLYIIHVRARLWDADANEFVEKDKVIKWFGSLRPIDLDTF